MKPSYFQTPRRLDECHFASNADPIERHVRPFDAQDRIVMWAVVITAVASLLVVFA